MQELLGSKQSTKPQEEAVDHGETSVNPSSLSKASR
jgi:hypothetical protein